MGYEADGAGKPDYLNTGDNAWMMLAATIVGMQSVPGLVILYGSFVKKKWAINSAFMAFYAFAAVLLFWVFFAFDLSFNQNKPLIHYFWGRVEFIAMSQESLLENWPYQNVPTATIVFFQAVFAAITLILVAGSLLGRMNFHAWMLFVPLWLTFSYSISAYSMWTGFFASKYTAIDFAGGYVIHLSSGVAGFTAAFWVGPRSTKDRETFLPNNVLLMLAGAGMLWLGWSGFNGGAPLSANVLASLAVINTHICTATSLLTWMCLDMLVLGKPSVIGAVQGMITGLVCITPGAGVVQAWAAVVMGLLSGSIPWFTMMVIQKRSSLLQKVDDTMGMLHTHGVTGLLGGLLSGFFAHPHLCDLLYTVKHKPIGFIYGRHRSGIRQMGIQLFAALFVIILNVVVTSIICLVIQLIAPLRMSDDVLEMGDDAVHGEEAYALWDDGENSKLSKQRKANEMHVFDDNSGLLPKRNTTAGKVDVGKVVCSKTVRNWLEH